MIQYIYLNYYNFVCFNNNEFGSNILMTAEKAKK